MELTQRFECTQELYSSDCEKINSEQIAFLGICGTKYPLKKGPNKIGRDPETCNIVLNLNSISRHHAVINILNSQDFMLMDLDSANKTKLSDRTLQPYIPQPIKNGDVVQFGQVFGVFRLLQEENDLPMTQPVDVVDTPVHNRHVSKLNVHATTIPESPEISDKDDSFIASSQQKSKNVFKSPNINFLKSSGKTISIKPIGTNKIDNAYWSSSKKSDSFSMQSNISSNLNDSVASSHTNEQKQNIHEMDTQIPYLNYSENEKIHELDTQIPNAMPNESIDSIYNANTQIVESVGSPNIYEMETQLPTPEKLPEVCKIQEQENLHINFTTDDKENDNNIHNAETQVVLCVKPTSPRVNVTNNPKLTSSSNISDDIILFDEVDNEPLPDNFESQQLLSPKLNIENDENNAESQDIHFVPRKRANIIESDSSTDCEDINIAFTQKIPEIKNDDDLTDCEEEPNIFLKTNRKQRKSPDVEEDVTDCEDNLNDNDIVQPNENIENLLAEIVDEIKTDKEMTDVAKKDDSLEDLPTQIIEESKSTESNRKQRTVFHDLPTQVLNNEAAKSTFEEALTQQIYSEEVVKFKVPFKSPVKKKKKVDTNVKLNNNSAVIEIVDDDENYYASTQELLDDLCSQRDLSPEVQITNKDENQSSTEKASVTGLIRKDSPECLDAKRKIEEFVSNLTCSQIQDVIGVQKEVTVLKKMPSDGSDVVATPKKIDCLSILETDLPNTQEIKTGISLSLHSDAESLTDNHSESEIDSKTSTPIKIKHKQKATNKIRINLSNKFDPETIPVRSSSRVRKPTSRIQNCDETFKDTAEKILKPKSKAQEVKIGRRRSKENSEKHTKEKSDKSKTKVEDCDPSKTSNIIGTDQHYSKGNIEIDNTKKTKSKRGRKPKQKDETNVYELKIEATTSKELNESNSTDRRTLRKQKEEGKRRCESNSSSKTSKTPDEEKSRPDVTNKSNRKHTKERSTSPEIERDTTITKDKSRSAKLQVRKKSKERSKPEIEKQSNETTTERSRSSEKESNRKHTKERSTSPEIERDTTITKDKSRSAKLQVRKKSKERSKPEIEKQSNETTTERSRSSEKESKTKSTGERSKSRDEREVKKSTEESNKSIQKSEETDVRRSKRNRDKKSEEPIDVSRPNSSKHGLSTVYSTIDISSDSGTDTPNKLKRPATCEPEIPNAKKARSGGNTHKSILRATPARKDKTQYVLFTAFPCDEVKNKLVELGAVIVSDVTTCTVVLTLQIKRTFKLLCAVGLGKPIVGPNWVQACADTKMIVDPWLYLLKDEETERRFKFSLQQTLAGRREFLKGYNVSSTPNVVPKAAEMKLIVECSGGQWKEGGPKWVCVSNPADCALWAGLKRRGAVVVSTEFILGGVLTQTLDIEKTML